MNSKHLIESIEKDSKNKVIILGGMHGNEVAGIESIYNVINQLNQNIKLQKGSIFFLKGNIGAIKTGERFIEKDLNRLWLDKYIFSDTSDISDIKELKSIYHLIVDEICQENFDNCIFMDLHTFSANSGIFCIPAPNKKSLDLAASFGIPFIEKLAESLPGTAISHLGRKGMTSIVVEGGTHGSKEAVDNLEAAIWHLLGYAGLVDKNLYIVKNSRKKLKKLGTHFPYHLELSYRHQLEDSKVFKMKEGYYNFKQIQKKEELATEKNITVKSPDSGFMLMPLYQKKGSDGFFIVKEVKDIYHKNEI